MKTKYKLLIVIAVLLTAAMPVFTACSFGGGDTPQPTPILTLSPSAVTITDGSLTATVSVEGSATGTVTLNTTALPAGVTASVAGNTITVAGVRLNTNVPAVTGSPIIAVTREGLTQSLTVNINLTTTWTAEQPDPDPTQLSAPQSLRVDGRYLRWNEVSNATAYVVRVNGTAQHSVTATQFSLSGLALGEHVFAVKALGNGAAFTDSDFSAEITHNVVPMPLKTPIISFDSTTNSLLLRDIDTNAIGFMLSLEGSALLDELVEILETLGGVLPLFYTDLTPTQNIGEYYLDLSHLLKTEGGTVSGFILAFADPDDEAHLNSGQGTFSGVVWDQTAPPPTLTLNPTSVTINDGNLTATVNVGGTATGVVTVNTAALPTGVSASVNGTVITITGIRPNTDVPAIIGSPVIVVSRGGLTQNLTVNINLTTTWVPPTGVQLGVVQHLTVQSNHIGESTITITRGNGPHDSAAAVTIIVGGIHQFNIPGFGNTVNVPADLFHLNQQVTITAQKMGGQTVADGVTVNGAVVSFTYTRNTTLPNPVVTFNGAANRLEITQGGANFYGIVLSLNGSGLIGGSFNGTFTTASGLTAAGGAWHLNMSANINAAGGTFSGTAISIPQNTAHFNQSGPVSVNGVVEEQQPEGWFISQTPPRLRSQMTGVQNFFRAQLAKPELVLGLVRIPEATGGTGLVGSQSVMMFPVGTPIISNVSWPEGGGWVHAELSLPVTSLPGLPGFPGLDPNTTLAQRDARMVEIITVARAGAGAGSHALRQLLRQLNPTQELDEAAEAITNSRTNVSTRFLNLEIRHIEDERIEVTWFTASAGTGHQTTEVWRLEGPIGAWPGAPIWGFDEFNEWNQGSTYNNLLDIIVSHHQGNPGASNMATVFRESTATTPVGDILRIAPEFRTNVQFFDAINPNP